MNMLASDKNTHFRPDFDVGQATVHRAGVSNKAKLSRPSDFATAAKLVCVVLDELNPSAVNRQGDRQHA
jgi:hypothetical protein